MKDNIRYFIDDDGDVWGLAPDGKEKLFTNINVDGEVREIVQKWHEPGKYGDLTILDMHWEEVTKEEAFVRSL